ncbi:MAG: cytochrome c oxidase assembly protein [Hyphomicrobiales bacterium]
MTYRRAAARGGKTATLVAINLILLMMIVLVSYAPTLYRMFCQETGYGGTTGRSVMISRKMATKVPITVRFDANTAPGLDWEFKPDQQEVETHIGEPTKAYYRARNISDHPIVGRATYNVTPGWVGPYFFKVVCFCFTEQRLEPGEEARMPLLFYIDQDILEDEDSKNIHTVTLSYTFFRQDGLSEEEVSAIRNLSTGSQKEEISIKNEDRQVFYNDVHK